ncbi:MAG: DUF2304 domain-containing protein [Oscillospiraceae bacterium]|nr:DUF2304 domain-containing protein [Oscillospiraceae bacterium]
MPFIQRIFLILGSIATLVYFISKIRKSKLKINHSIFWVVFGLVLLLLALIPDGVFWISGVLGFQSPSNLIYLIVIFLLTVKLFTTTMRISKLSEQVTALTHALAIQQLKAEDAEKKTMDDSTKV